MMVNCTPFFAFFLRDAIFCCGIIETSSSRLDPPDSFSCQLLLRPSIQTLNRLGEDLISASVDRFYFQNARRSILDMLLFQVNTI